MEAQSLSLPWTLAEPRGDARQRLGRDGELAAEVALCRAGLRILDRRFRLRIGEIDLIALDSDIVVFIEVKARRGSGYGTPGEAVGSVKRRRIARVAAAWLQRRGWLERRCRFDVVEVHAGPDGVERVVHVADAFRLWPTG